LNYSIMHRNYVLLILGVAMAFALTGTSFATPTVTLSSSLTSPQPVGTLITWTANASDNDPGTLMYSFSTGAQGQSLALVRDFGYLDTFPWNPPLQEGSYQVQVIVRNNSTGNTATASQPFVVTAIANSTNPVVISATANPLVALFSAAPCSAPDSMLVSFKSPAGVKQLTPLKTCNGLSMNFYVAGMQANTKYSMTGVLVNGGREVGTTKTKTATTGAVGVKVPTITVTGSAPPAAANEPLLVYTFSAPNFPTATDLNGNVVWYYNPYDGLLGLMTQPVAGGYFWIYGNGSTDPYTQPLREIDVAGNTIVETNVGRINEQLVAVGRHPLTDVDHELRTLVNGNILMIGSYDNILGQGVQNGADILIDDLVILNPGLQMIWSWDITTCGNCATMMPTSRYAILGETCKVGQGGCPPLTPPNTVANDWLHANCAQLATDGSILMSLRHQDWVLKVDYGNGTGTGDILWRLGLDGDFTIIGDPNDTYPWFSHQHNAQWQFGEIYGETYLALFDNGNTRIVQNNNVGDSRGQLLKINQNTKTATLLYNFDTGVQSLALGTAQMLINSKGTPNGLHYEAGFVNTNSGLTLSYYQTGTFSLTTSAPVYRAFQMHDLYTPDVQP
jgi:arylsulfate sulfotransferase